MLPTTCAARRAPSPEDTQRSAAVRRARSPEETQRCVAARRSNNDDAHISPISNIELIASTTDEELEKASADNRPETIEDACDFALSEDDDGASSEAEDGACSYASDGELSERSAEELSAEELSEDELSADELSADELSAEELSAEELSAEERSAEEFSAEEFSADGTEDGEREDGEREDGGREDGGTEDGGLSDGTEEGGRRQISPPSGGDSQIYRADGTSTNVPGAFSPQERLVERELPTQSYGPASSDEDNQEEAACCPRIPTESFADQRKALILMCCVCREVPVTPYQTECGHIGCALCFAKLEADTCPQCRAVMRQAPNHPALIQQMLDEELVTCTRAGCFWRGKAGSFVTHQGACLARRLKATEKELAACRRHMKGVFDVAAKAMSGAEQAEEEPVALEMRTRTVTSAARGKLVELTGEGSKRLRMLRMS